MRVPLASLLLIGVVLNAWPAKSATVVLSPIGDTTLFQLAPDNNLGGYASLAAGTTAHGDKARALLKFNVAGAIPSDARITAARLHLRVVRAPGSGGQPSQFTLHRVFASWNEGNKGQFATGSLASDGETTWNSRAHGSFLWQSPGGQAGTDFASLASMSSLVTTTGAYTFATSPQGVLDVQRWLERPAENQGWLLMSQSEATWETARRFGSREDSANQPMLEIDYAPVGISRVEHESGAIKIIFPVRPGFRYTVEARSLLASGPWSILTNFSPIAVTSEAVAFDSTQNLPAKIYRLGREPL